MTTLFCIICGISITFFIAFFLGCSRSTGRSNRKATPVHKISAPETQFADALGGRRFFAHLEQQMAEFLASHHRTVALMILSLLIFPALASAQSESGPSAETQTAATADESNPSTVESSTDPAESLPLTPASETSLAGLDSANGPGTTNQQTAPQQTNNTPQPDSKGKRKGFFRRLADVYQQDWKGGDSGPAPARCIPDSPLSSPPFPNADWPYGGSPVIGTPDTNTYPLMDALGKSASRIKVYGWLEPGFNFSTSNQTVFPMSYNIYANSIQLDQAVLYVERLPNTVQKEHFDWGFHATAFYGVDYRFTTAKGYFSQQLLLFNRQYGFDPVLEYADLYFPKVADGMNIRIGRYISVPGIEAQLAPSNYNYTHSLLFTFDPFTQTGILATIKLNDRWLVQAGLQAGNDVAPWTPDAKPSLTACINYTFPSGTNNLYGCVNGINNGTYAYNNVQQYDLTWYHKFSPTWHMATEAWYMYERQVPAVGGPIKPEVGANPAFCAPGQVRCFAPEWAAVNYLEKNFGSHDYLSIRTDFLDDIKGQRTGFVTRYSENEVMWGHWIGSTVLFRPGLRYEHSYDAMAYNGGTTSNQFSFTMDMVFKF